MENGNGFDQITSEFQKIAAEYDRVEQIGQTAADWHCGHVTALCNRRLEALKQALDALDTRARRYLTAATPREVQ